MTTDRALSIAKMGSFMAGGRSVRIDGEALETILFTAGFKDYGYDPNGELLPKFRYLHKSAL